MKRSRLVGLVLFVLFTVAAFPARAQNGDITLKVLNEKGKAVKHFYYNVTRTTAKTSSKIQVPTDGDAVDFFWNPGNPGETSWTPHKLDPVSGRLVWEVLRPDGTVYTNGTKAGGSSIKIKNVPPGAYTVRVTARMQIEEQHTETVPGGSMALPSWRETDASWNGPVVFRSIKREPYLGGTKFLYRVLRDVVIQSSQRTYVAAGETDEAVVLLPSLTQIFDQVRTIPTDQYSEIYRAIVSSPLTRTVVSAASSVAIKQFFTISDSALGYFAGVPATLIYAGMTPEQDLQQTVLNVVGSVGRSIVVSKCAAIGGLGGPATFALGVAVGVTWSYAQEGFYQLALETAVADSLGDDLETRRLAQGGTCEIRNYGEPLANVRIFSYDNTGRPSGAVPVGRESEWRSVASGGTAAFRGLTIETDVDRLLPRWKDAGDYPSCVVKMDYAFPDQTRTVAFPRLRGPLDRSGSFLDKTMPLPNFRIKKVVLTPKKPAAGQPFEATITLYNEGRKAGIPGRVAGFVNRPGEAAANAAADASVDVPDALGAKKSRKVVLEGLVAPAAPAGSFLFRAFVDHADASWETFETDNQFALSYATVIGPAKPVPIGPTGPQTATTLTYSWNAAANATKYELVVQRKRPTAALWLAWKASRNIAATAGKLTGHETGFAYRWWVRGVNSVAVGPWSDPLEFSIHLPTAVPECPVLVGPSGAIAEQTPTFAWNAAARASTYDLVVKKGITTVLDKTGLTGTNYAAPAALADGTYAWYARGVNVKGAGPWANPVSFTISTGGGVASDYMVIDLSGGPTAANYPVSYLSGVPAGGWTDEYKTTKLVLRRIPAGTFTMGSPEGELGRELRETQHSVTLTKDFYIGVFEVTQKQWERVMGNWPSYFNNAAYRETRPVDWVSYYEIRENSLPETDEAHKGSAISPNWPQSDQVHADSFIGRLRAKTRLTTFDLPTEAQWEYACRAVTTNALNSGFDLTNMYADAHMAEVGRYYHNHPGGHSSDPIVSTDGGTAKVGSYLPNAWGLYDMHGNVYEWCLDWYAGYPGAVSNPPGAASGSFRVIRGGGSIFDAWFCRSPSRNCFSPDSRYYSCGFRLSRTLP